MRKCLCSGRRARTAPISARPPPPKGLSPRLTSLLPLLHPAPATHPLTQSPPLPSLWRCAEYRRARSCMAGLQRMLSSLSPALRVLFCSTFSLYARLPVPSSSSSFLVSLSVSAASLSSLHLSLSSPFLHRHPRDSQPPNPPRRICFTKPSIFSSLHRLPSFLSVSFSFQKSIYY